MTKAREFWQTQGSNFMTPTVIEYIDTPRFLVELSSGTGMNDEPIYGVSVASLDGERDHELSKMFWDETEAREFIEGELF